MPSFVVARHIEAREDIFTAEISVATPSGTRRDRVMWTASGRAGGVARRRLPPRPQSSSMPMRTATARDRHPRARRRVCRFHTHGERCRGSGGMTLSRDGVAGGRCGVAAARCAARHPHRRRSNRPADRRRQSRRRSSGAIGCASTIRSARACACCTGWTWPARAGRLPRARFATGAANALMKRSTMRRCRAARSIRCFYDAGLDTVFWVFPNDRKIAGLAAVSERRAVADNSGPSRRWHSTRLVAYAPEKSATLACLDESGAIVAYAKVSAHDQAEHDYARIERSATRSPAIPGCDCRARWPIFRSTGCC